MIVPRILVVGLVNAALMSCFANKNVHQRGVEMM
jgi:hypothetical protein